MKICSITITSRTKQDIVADAIKSVLPWVDGCLIVELDSGDDATVQRALEAAKGKGIVHTIPLAGTMADWRNTGLALAAQHGFDWAVMLDTDERIVAGKTNVRLTLAQTKHDVLSVLHDSGIYSKPRFFRLPCKHQFVGDIHEEFRMTEGEAPELDGVRFSELPKRDEDPAKRWAFYKDGLLKQLESEPNNGRWLMYLGHMSAVLGQPHEAVDWYEKAAAAFGKTDFAGWCLTRAATVQYELGDFDACRLTSARAISIAPYMAEPACMMAWVDLEQGRLLQAQAWANIAIMHNGEAVQRQGNREPHALYEEPWEILQQIFAARGDKQHEVEMGRRVEIERRKRIKRFGGDA